MGNPLRSPWSGHWREAEFFSFVRWALGQHDLRSRYRNSTGDQFEPSAEPAEMERQAASGEALGYIERYAEWLAHNVFGTPDEPNEVVDLAARRTLH